MMYIYCQHKKQLYDEESRLAVADHSRFDTYTKSLPIWFKVDYLFRLNSVQGLEDGMRLINPVLAR